MSRKTQIDDAKTTLMAAALDGIRRDCWFKTADVCTDDQRVIQVTRQVGEDIVLFEITIRESLAC